MNKEHEQQRRQLWCDVYVALVRSGNSTDENEGRLWSDIALAEFDRRFKAPKEISTNPALNVKTE